MASYVSPDYNPAYYDLPVFEAPVDLAFRVSQQKQGQFDEGLKQVQYQRQKGLTLGVMSQYNVARRDAFMKEADTKLRNIVGADFSLQENVNIANGIYKPLTQDRYILKELSHLQGGRKALSLMNEDRTAKTKEQRDMYNSDSEFLVNYEMNRIAKASSQEELDSIDNDNLTYVRATDFEKRFLEVLKGVGGVSKDEIVNKYYKYTTVNGEQAIGPLTTLGLSMMTPEDQAYYRNVAKAQIVRTKEGLVANGYSEDGAREYIAKGILEGEKTSINNDIKSYKEQLSYYTKLLEEAGSAKGEMTDDEQRATDMIREQINKKMDALKDVISTKEVEADSFDEIKNPNAYKKNLDFYKARPEVGAGNVLQYRKASNIATGWANSTKKFTIGQEEVNLKLLDYQTKVLEQEAKNRESERKSREETDKSKNKSPEIVPLETSPHNIPLSKVYDKVTKDKALLIETNNAFKKEMINTILSTPEFLDVSRNFKHTYLDDIYNKIQEGKGSDIATEEVISAIRDITGDKNISTYNELEKSLAGWGNKKTSELIEKVTGDPTDNNMQNLAGIKRLQSEIDKHEGLINKIRVTEENITDKALTSSDKKYDKITATDGEGIKRIISEDEYLNSNTEYTLVLPSTKLLGGSPTRGAYPSHRREYWSEETLSKELGRKVISEPREGGSSSPEFKVTLLEVKKLQEKFPQMKFELLEEKNRFKRGVDAGFLGVDNSLMSKNSSLNYKRANDIIEREVKEYTQLSDPIKESVAQEILPHIYGATTTLTGKNVAFQYGKFRLPFNDDVTNLGETIVPRLLDSRFINKVIANMGIKGEDKVNAYVSVIQRVAAQSTNLKDEDGSIEVSPVGKDNVSPEYKLRLTAKFLGEIFPEFVRKDWSSEEKAAFDNIVRDGIVVNDGELNREITRDLAGKFSITASMINLSPDEKREFSKWDDKHYILIQKGIDNGYKITPYSLDEKGNSRYRTMTISKDEVSKLDNLLRTLESQIMSDFFKDKQKKGVKKPIDILTQQ